MGAADKAYEAAERRIAIAKRLATDGLSFDSGEFLALERLPPSISELSALRRLDLRDTKVADLSPLAGMTEILVLRLDRSLVSDLSSLATLTGITHLFIDKTQVADLSPLASMSGIKHLTLSNTRVRDLTSLSGLAGITHLFIGNTQVSDLAPLARMTGMTRLLISNTQVNDLTPLAGMTRMDDLSISNTQVGDLTPLAGMTRITRLDLHNTQVTDLTPLAGMSELNRLSLDNTQVSDLRVLRGLAGLVNAPPFGDLTFTNCRAARLDARIAEIAKMGTSTFRSRALFQYLRDWEPPAPEAPEPDPFLETVLRDGKLEIDAGLPTDAEVDERLKRRLHERLIEKSADLVRAAGNRFPRLATRAQALRAQVDKPFEDLDLLTLHIEIGDLTDRAALGSEDGESYPAETQAAVGDVTRIGPGLTLDNPDVEMFLARRRRAREEPAPAAELAAHEALSRAILASPNANGPNSLQLERLAIEIADPAAAQAISQAKHRNLLWRLGVMATRLAGSLGVGVAGNLISAAYGPAIADFVTLHWAELVRVAASYGAPFADWFTSTAGQLIAPLAGQQFPPFPPRGRGK